MKKINPLLIVMLTLLALVTKNSQGQNIRKTDSTITIEMSTSDIKIDSIKYSVYGINKDSVIMQVFMQGFGDKTVTFDKFEKKGNSYLCTKTEMYENGEKSKYYEDSKDLRSSKESGFSNYLYCYLKDWNLPGDYVYNGQGYDSPCGKLIKKRIYK